MSWSLEKLKDAASAAQSVAVARAQQTRVPSPPSGDLTIAWAAELSTGSKLRSADSRRVRRALETRRVLAISFSYPQESFPLRSPPSSSEAGVHGQSTSFRLRRDRAASRDAASVSPIVWTPQPRPCRFGIPPRTARHRERLAATADACPFRPRHCHCRRCTSRREGSFYLPFRSTPRPSGRYHRHQVTAQSGRSGRSPP